MAAKSIILSIKTFFLQIKSWQTLQLQFSVGDMCFLFWKFYHDQESSLETVNRKLEPVDINEQSDV